MEFSIIIAIKWFIANLLACLAQVSAQELDYQKDRIPARHSMIRGTNQKFLYLEDFSTQTWGDIMGLGLVWVAFGHVWEYLAPINWLLAWATAFLGGLGFWLYCRRPQHRPDWGYPRPGKTSLGGVVHLFYFGASLAMASIGLGVTIYGILQDIPLFLFIVGAVIWIAAAIHDFTRGHFDPLKPS